MLPDKRPRLIFFLYLITMAQYKSKIYRKIGYRESVFSSLSSRHLPAILNITKRALGLVLVLLSKVQRTKQRTRSKLYALTPELRDVNKELGRPETKCDKLKGIFVINPWIYTLACKVIRT